MESKGWIEKLLADGASSVSARVARLDSWVNGLSGLGTSRDKTTWMTPQADVLLPPLLCSTLFNSDDIAAKIAMAIPDECFRAGFQVINTSPEDDAADDVHTRTLELETDLKRLGARKKLREAQVWGRVYGLGAVLIGADDDQESWEPLDLDRVSEIRYLTVFDKRDLTPRQWYTDCHAPKFGEVSHYAVHPVGVYIDARSYTGQPVVHESRLIKFGGQLTSNREKTRNQGTDYSIFQNLYRALQLTNGNWQSAASLLADASQGVFTIRGLIDSITARSDVMQTRMALVDQMRSTLRAIILDADGEKFERVPTPFAGIPEMLIQTWNRLAIGARMPLIKLIGSAPVGLGDQEEVIEIWYNDVEAIQRDEVVPAFEQVLQVCAAARGYEDRDDWTVRPHPLKRSSLAEIADNNLKTMQAAQIRVDSGLASPEEMALSLDADPTGNTITIDVEARKAILDTRMQAEAAAVQAQLKAAKEPPVTTTKTEAT